jgi:hypothetical protein
VLDHIDAVELRDWMDFQTIVPFGPSGDDARLGQIACLLANQWRGSMEKKASLYDLFPWTRPTPDAEESTAEELHEEARVLATHFGAAVHAPAPRPLGAP